MVFHQNRYAEELDSALKEGCHWLDIGAGARIHGGWTVPQGKLASRASRLVGCDVECFHIAVNPYLTEYYVCSAERMPFDDHSFDLVTANMVLEHLDDPNLVFQEVHRVLKSDGRFIFLTPHKYHPFVWLASALLHRSWRTWLVRFSDKRTPEHIFPTLYKVNTVQDIVRVGRAAGFRVDKLEAFRSLPFLKGWLGQLEIMMGGAFGWRSNLIGVLRPV